MADGITVHGRYIQLSNISGTLSGDILRLRRNLPNLTDNWDIDGDKVTKIESVPIPPEENFPEDFDHTDADLELLPLIEIDESKHFVKRCKYRREILNLLKCQGDSCPGTPISPHLIHLLGKSADGKLVFEKLFPWQHGVSQASSLTDYKRWLLQLIEALRCLHSFGIIHRDLSLKNIMFSQDRQNLVLIDLESKWGTFFAPELTSTIDDKKLDDAGWSAQSDIYDIGPLLKGWVYRNVPINTLIEWPVPQPLDTIVEACTKAVPEQRPSLEELNKIVEAIEIIC
ncbi:kinase-like domain-containing protein [Nemania sp. FL0916]|nr:kinase-like domain-containing protein [Nemania sp. FL0916]